MKTHTKPTAACAQSLTTQDRTGKRPPVNGKALNKTAQKQVNDYVPTR